MDRARRRRRATDRLWASPLYGEPGFITTPDESTVHIAAQPLPGDPLTRIEGAVGALALEPATRRRMRLNGQASTAEDGITIALDQVYGNCPKYIATRHAMPHRAAPQRVQPSLERLTRADTAFVATRAPEGTDALPPRRQPRASCTSTKTP